MNQKIPEYLAKFSVNIQMLIFVLVFSIVFVSVYTPFDLNTLYQSLDDLMKAVYIVITVVGCVSILVISRLILWAVCKRERISMLQYIIWIAAEIVTIVFVYAVFSKFVLDDERAFGEIFERALIFVPSILFIPYLVSYMYYSLKEKNRKLNTLLDKQEIWDNKPYTHVDEVFNFCDEKGKLKLSMLLANVYYIAAADNYVNIYYIDNGHLVHYMLRNNLKELEEKLQSKGFCRNHRSYIVNMQKIKMISREKEGLFIIFDSDEVAPVPVSKTYSEQIVEKFASAN
ncbi:MAG: hypothetical protein CW341_05360 [Bacteroidetes bacterium]|nr:hypothetical protein [Bacteroidota bacterium]